MKETLLDIGLGIDFGTKNIGLALIFIKSEIVSPLKSILNKRHSILAEFDEIFASYSISFIVAGLPPKEGLAKKAKYFLNTLLDKKELPIYLVSEGLTTVHSKNMLSFLRKDTGFKVKESKARDAVSATLILEEWLTYYKENKHGILQYRKDSKKKAAA